MLRRGFPTSKAIKRNPLLQKASPTPWLKAAAGQRWGGWCGLGGFPCFSLALCLLPCPPRHGGGVLSEEGGSPARAAQGPPVPYRVPTATHPQQNQTPGSSKRGLAEGAGSLLAQAAHSGGRAPTPGRRTFSPHEVAGGRVTLTGLRDANGPRASGAQLVPDLAAAKAPNSSSF